MMILHYFNKKENKDKDLASKVYLSLVNFIQEIISNKDFSIKKNFNSSFELMSIFLFIIFFCYKKGRKNKSVNQILMNLFISDIDKTLRDLGISDNNIGKYVKTYVKKFYYRISKLENILTSNKNSDFTKYIKKINIIKDSEVKKLSIFLFEVINILLKNAKTEELSEFTFKNLNN